MGSKTVWITTQNVDGRLACSGVYLNSEAIDQALERARIQVEVERHEVLLAQRGSVSGLGSFYSDSGLLCARPTNVAVHVKGGTILAVGVIQCPPDYRQIAIWNGLHLLEEMFDNWNPDLGVGYVSLEAKMGEGEFLVILRDVSLNDCVW